MTFKDKVKNYIAEKGLINSGDRILCALSGGSDSVALLTVLNGLKTALGFSLCAAHFNHGIRGAEADRDQEFSHDLCKRLQIPFFTALEDIPRIAKENGEGLEECARNRRYGFLFRTAEEQGCNKIATAHHATDNTETVLFHLIRGTGLNGLGGIAPQRNDGVIRPLLCVSKAEVEEFLRENGSEFVTDSTNADTDMTRNFIRLRMLPLVRAVNPAADRALIRLSDSAREDEEYFLREAEKLPKKATLSTLKTVPTPILKRYIRLRYAEAKQASAQLDHDMLTVICRDIKNGIGRFRYSVSGDIAVIGDRDTLEFTADKMPPVSYSFDVSAIGEYKTANGTVFVTENKAEMIDWAKKNPSTSYIAYPTDDTEWRFTVRSAEEGDRYKRGGIHRAVRKELNTISYPAHKRSALPRFCDGDGIFWVPYLKPGDKTVEQKSKQIIYIGYTEN